MRIRKVRGMNERELTRAERIAIRTLVTKECANYDRDYGCLPLDCECYMINKRYTGAYCRYFENSMLPLDTDLEDTLSGRKAPVSETRVCGICGETFRMNVNNQVYCSSDCQAEGNRRRSRARMQKKRDGKPEDECYDSETG